MSCLTLNIPVIHFFNGQYLNNHLFNSLNDYSILSGSISASQWYILCLFLIIIERVDIQTLASLASGCHHLLVVALLFCWLPPTIYPPPSSLSRFFLLLLYFPLHSSSLIFLLAYFLPIQLPFSTNTNHGKRFYSLFSTFFYFYHHYLFILHLAIHT